MVVDTEVEEESVVVDTEAEAEEESVALDTEAAVGPALASLLEVEEAMEAVVALGRAPVAVPPRSYGEPPRLRPPNLAGGTERGSQSPKGEEASFIFQWQQHSPPEPNSGIQKRNELCPLQLTPSKCHLIPIASSQKGVG